MFGLGRFRNSGAPKRGDELTAAILQAATAAGQSESDDGELWNQMTMISEALHSAGG